jgi:hypothetical protein
VIARSAAPARSFPSPLAGEGKEKRATPPYLTAIGETVEPVPPWIFNGCMMKANS